MLFLVHRTYVKHDACASVYFARADGASRKFAPQRFDRGSRLSQQIASAKATHARM